MSGSELDDIEALKANRKTLKLSSEEQEKLRRNVQKIMQRREADEKARRRAEMEQYLYELDLYA